MTATGPMDSSAPPNLDGPMAETAAAPPSAIIAPAAMPVTAEAPPPAKAPLPMAKRRFTVTTVGLPPTAQDLGGEADMVSVVNDPRIPVPKSKKWNFYLRGFIRAPLRFSVGPRTDLTSGNQWHTPAHVPGMNYDDWGFTGLVARPQASFYLTALTKYASAHLIVATENFPDSGYANLVKTGGITQGYVTLRHPDLFGETGGLAWTVGAFSNRYGNAGPNGWSSGYYGTYLFGRTHVAGSTLTTSLELPGNIDLDLEGGFGAKLDVTPYIGLDHIPEPPMAPYLPQQGVVAMGSNFISHGHFALGFLNSIKVSGHYLRSWSSGDCGTSQPCPMAVLNGIGFREGTRVPDIYMNIFGGDRRFDHKTYGNGYIGYSKVQGQNLYSLANGIEVIHGDGGMSFAQNYFGALQWQPKMVGKDQNETIPPNFYAGPKNDTGNVQTVLFQYQIKASSFFGRNLGMPDEGLTRGKHDIALAIFGMYNRVSYTKCTANSIVNAASPIPRPNLNVLQPSQAVLPIDNCSSHTTMAYDKLKVGADLNLMLSRNIAIGTRFDRVMPTGWGSSGDSYSAISPRLFFRTGWISREYIMVGYTRYLYASDDGLRAYGLGTGTTPYKYMDADKNVGNYPTYSSPYPFGGFASDYLTQIDRRKPDPNLFTMTAVVAF
jgi:hypothetical protein